MITHVEPPRTVVNQEDFPKDDLPEFLLLGRSNVGKSSFINTLLSRKNLAYTSGRPGKTQTLNFYRINQAFYLVDAPGYGYARVSKKDREAFGHMIENYLNHREVLTHVVLLIDMRHTPTEDDRIMSQYLLHFGVPFTIVATKADKCSNNQRQKQLAQIRNILKLSSDYDVISFSATTGLNKERILQNIIQLSSTNP